MVPVIDLEKRLLRSHIKGGFYYDSDYGTYGQRERRHGKLSKAYLNTHFRTAAWFPQRMPRPTTRWKKEVTDFAHDIERLQRQEEIDKMLSAPTSAPLTGKPGAKNEPDDKPGIASKAYKAAFWNNIRKRNYYDVKDVLEIGTDANGGYLVPDEYEKRLIDALQEENFFRTIATVIQNPERHAHHPGRCFPRTAAWMEENGLYPESDDTFRPDQPLSLLFGHGNQGIRGTYERFRFRSRDLHCIGVWPQDRRCGGKHSLTGDGSKKPEGIFTKVAATKGATTEITGSTVSFDNIMDVFHSLRSVYRSKAIWILNDTTIKALRKIKDNNGNYIWQPSVVVGQPDTILNRPYKTSDLCAGLVAGNVPILFGDFSYYWIAERQGRSFKAPLRALRGKRPDRLPCL